MNAPFFGPLPFRTHYVIRFGGVMAWGIEPQTSIYRTRINTARTTIEPTPLEKYANFFLFISFLS